MVKKVSAAKTQRNRAETRCVPMSFSKTEISLRSQERLQFIGGVAEQVAATRNISVGWFPGDPLTITDGTVRLTWYDGTYENGIPRHESLVFPTEYLTLSEEQIRVREAAK